MEGNQKLILTHLADSQSEQPASQMGIFMRNIVLFSSTLLQILYSGIFLGDAENLLSFLADQILMVRQYSERNVYINIYFSCNYIIFLIINL